MLKRLQQEIRTCKTIIIILGIMLVLTMIPLAIGIRYYQWMVTDPFSYNDTEADHSWLPQVVEPRLTMYRYDIPGSKSVLLDTRIEKYIVYDDQDNCWHYSTDCAKDHIQIRNDTDYTWLLLVTGKPTIDMTEGCPIHEVREDETLYDMVPGCYFLFFPPTDDNTVVLITYPGEK